MLKDEVVKIVAKTVTKAKKNKDFKILEKFLIESLTSDADNTVKLMQKYQAD